MQQNLRVVFGNTFSDEKEKTMLYQSCKNLFLTAFETLRFPIHGQRYLDELILNNFYYLETSVQQEKGVILLAPHTGNFFMGAAYMAQQFPVSIMIRPPRNKQLRNLLQKSFQSMNFETIDRVGGMHQAIRAIRNKRILVIAMDQHAGGHGIWIDFFGQEASTYPTAAALALRYDVPVHIGYLHRHPNGTNEAWTTPAIELIRTGDMDEDIRKNTILFSEKIEEIIRKYPETWMWMHRRWKERPLQMKPHNGDYPSKSMVNSE
jgi:KDO2-lipid IV(A) lauroyltransferase